MGARLYRNLSHAFVAAATIALPAGQNRTPTSRRPCRREAAKRFVGVAGLLALALVGGGDSLPSAGAQSPHRPNVVVIVLDDLSKSMFERSRLRRQTEAGVGFANAFAPTPVCCPARSTILTGRYTHSHRVTRNRYKATGFSGGEREFREQGLERRTVAYLLKRSGYTTSLMGKYLNGYGVNDGGPTRNDPEAPPDEPDEEGSHWLRVPPGWSDWRVGANINGEWVPTGTRNKIDWLRRHAVEFVRAQARRRGPYFLYVASHIPHNEQPPPARYMHAHDGEPLPKPPSYNEEDTADKPGYIARDKKLPGPGVRPEDCSRNDWPIAYPTHDVRCTYSEDYSRHYWENGLEGLEGVRDLYKQLLTTLRDVGELDNTYVVLVSDNGVHLGEHRQAYGKNTPYIEDVEVPFTVTGPGVPAHRVREHLVGLQDLAPTVLDLARVTVPAGMEGRSLRPLLRGAPPPTSSWRERMLIEGFPGPNANRPYSKQGDTPLWRGLVTRGGKKYVEYPTTGETEYYNLRADRYELDNLASSLSPPLLEDLAATTKRLAKCSDGSSCRAGEDESPHVSSGGR